MQSEETESQKHERMKRLREGSSKIQREVKAQTIGYIVGALGLVAGLAWNDAIKALIDHFFSSDRNSLPAKFIYAAVITLAVVTLTIWLMKFKGDTDKDK